MGPECVVNAHIRLERSLRRGDLIGAIERWLSRWDNQLDQHHNHIAFFS